ncbi:MAG: hypothetical protein OEW93_01560 [Candidatus Bathyarchaeota archaeon]|nr:hypothetical protein [Candidatus Bathyarchaeota archaeon]
MAIGIIMIKGNVRYEIRTDREEYFVGETVHASFVIVNGLPFPVPTSAITKIDFGCTLNGKPTGAGYSAHITPTGRTIFLKPGEETWLTPVKIFANEPGELKIYVRVEGPDRESTYTKTVTIKP